MGKCPHCQQPVKTVMAEYVTATVPSGKRHSTAPASRARTVRPSSAWELTTSLPDRTCKTRSSIASWCCCDAANRKTVLVNRRFQPIADSTTFTATLHASHPTIETGF